MEMNLEDLYRLLRNGHVQAQSIVDTVPDPLLVLDQNLCVQTASRAFFATFKVDRDETIGQQLYELGNRQWDIPELRLLLEDVIPKSMAVVDYEVDHDFPSIGRRTMLVTARRLFHPDNNSRTLLLSIIDATAQRQREAEKDVLLAELRHRTKNLLAVVQALARQTTAAGRSGEEYREDFLGRFNALIAAHDAAFSDSGETETELKEVVGRTLEPYSEASAGILVESGPPVRLASQQVVSRASRLALAVMLAGSATLAGCVPPDKSHTFRPAWASGASDRDPSVISPSKLESEAEPQPGPNG